MGERRSWTITIPNWHPTSLNRLLTKHWAAAARAKKADQIHLALALGRAGVPRVAYPPSVIRQARKAGVTLPDPPQAIPRRLTVEIVLAPEPRNRRGQWVKGGQEYDSDNLSKSLRDALVQGGWLVDDSPKWLVSSEPVQRRGEKPATIITLEDLVEVLA